MGRTEREKERRFEGWVGARSGLVNLIKERLCPDSKDFKLQGGIIRFAYQKMWGVERKEGQN